MIGVRSKIGEGRIVHGDIIIIVGALSLFKFICRISVVVSIICGGAFVLIGTCLRASRGSRVVLVVDFHSVVVARFFIIRITATCRVVRVRFLGFTAAAARNVIHSAYSNLLAEA